MPALRSPLRLEKLDDRWLPDATTLSPPLGSDSVPAQVSDPPVLITPPDPTSPTVTPQTPTDPPVIASPPGSNTPEPVTTTSTTTTDTTPTPGTSVSPSTSDLIPPELKTWIDYIQGNTPAMALKRLPTPIKGPLYANGKAPDPDGVNGGGRVQQGGMGDCWFVAVAISIGRSRPNDIVNMIKDNKDGSFTVTFPGDPSKPVTVVYDAQAPGEQGQDGIWVRVLEQASAKYWNDNALWTRKDDPLQQIANGAPAQDAIKLLTGCGGNWDFKCGKGSLDNVTSWNDAIDAALKNNKVVVLETQSGNKNVKEGDPVEQDEGIVRGHEYVVIGYDSSSKMLKIRNPWGSGGEYQQGYSQKEIGGKKYWVWSDDPPDHKNDGTFTMSLDDAYRLFKNVTYEK